MVNRWVDQVSKSRILVPGILCRYGRKEQSKNRRVYPQSAWRRQAGRTNDDVGEGWQPVYGQQVTALSKCQTVLRPWGRRWNIGLRPNMKNHRLGWWMLIIWRTPASWTPCARRSFSMWRRQSGSSSVDDKQRGSRRQRYMVWGLVPSLWRNRKRLRSLENSGKTVRSLPEKQQHNLVCHTASSSNG